MRPNKIIYIYCSLSDCMLIKKTLPMIQNGYILSLYIAQKETSIKQIRKVQLKSKYTQGDYLILIDTPQRLSFRDDYTSANILHFSNVDAFFIWISSIERDD